MAVPNRRGLAGSGIEAIREQVAAMTSRACQMPEIVRFTNSDAGPHNPLVGQLLRRFTRRRGFSVQGARRCELPLHWPNQVSKACKPSELWIHDDSAAHRGHAGRCFKKPAPARLYSLRSEESLA